jgi:putative exported lipoprotein
MATLDRIKKLYELSLSYTLGIIPIHYEKQWQTVRGGYRTLYTGRSSVYLAYCFPKNAHYYTTYLTGLNYLKKGYSEDEYVRYGTSKILYLLKKLSEDDDLAILIYDELNCHLEDYGFKNIENIDVNIYTKRFKSIVDKYFSDKDIAKIYMRGNSKTRYVFRLRKYNPLEKEDIMTDFQSEVGNKRPFNLYKRVCFDSLLVWVDFSIYLNFSSPYYGEINHCRFYDKIEKKEGLYNLALLDKEGLSTALDILLQAEPEFINKDCYLEPVDIGYRDSFCYDVNRLILPLTLHDELSTLIEQERERLIEKQKLEKQRMLAKQDFNLKNKHTRDTYINFNSLLHTYTYQSQKLKPVTKVLEQFFPQFNTDYWAQIKSTQLGMSVSDVIAMWKAKGEEAAKKGTLLHQRIDDFLHNKEVTTNDDDFKLFKIFYSNCQLNPFRTEWTIYDETSSIAGTVDLLDYTNGKYTIYDWKRSNKIVKNCEVIKNYGAEMGLSPINDLENTAYWHYTLQLSFYRYILEKKYNIEVSESKLVVLHPENQLPYVLSVPYMKTHIIKMIQQLNR